MSVRPGGTAQPVVATLPCAACGREFLIEDGIYPLMPDEFRAEAVPPGGPIDAAPAQKRREMRQRDERAVVTGAGYSPSLGLRWSG